MIEIVQARTGAEILKRNGRCLASPYDPVREGEAWAERAAAAVPKDGGAFVLGLGSGYGASALLRRLGPERIAILEANAEVVARAREIVAQAGDGAGCAALAFDRVACAVTPDEAMDLAPSKAILRLRFAILPFGPSVDTEPEWYRRAAALLAAREPWAFRWAVARRPELGSSLDLEKLEKIEGLASISTILGLMRADAKGRETAVWRALGELAR